MATRIPFLLMCFAGSCAFAEDALQSAVREELRRLIDAIQARREPDQRHFVSLTQSETVETAIRSLRKFLREQREPPLSELSPPVLVVDSVSAVDGKAGACVHVVRYGSVINLRLTSVEFGFEKVKDRWRVESVRRDAVCGEKEKGGRGWLPPL